ncbi:hypothetical protein IAQ61_011548 [Plenodomus lingam]|uniref:uncharacterized protein n=1 Tax=Leptosphaeria maculans TaxID=5022 RepID=UPI0033178428|nr:hypothetical protein IAQ61_011548 [Plenodomus lingam]
MHKPCTLCHTPRPVLIRCQIDGTRTWHFVCPGKCWQSVSGGVEDAKGFEGQFPEYRYGGMVSFASFFGWIGGIGEGRKRGGRVVKEEKTNSDHLNRTEDINP